MKQLFRNGAPLTTSPGEASKINYNNSTSGLEASNVQEAIDKLNIKLKDIVEDATNGMSIHEKLDIILNGTVEVGGKIATGTVNITTSNNEKVTLGFKPTVVCGYNIRYMFIYCEEMSADKVMRFSASTLTTYALSSSNVNSLATIDEDGFTIGKASDTNNDEPITYIAVGPSDESVDGPAEFYEISNEYTFLSDYSRVYIVASRAATTNTFTLNGTEITNIKQTISNTNNNYMTWIVDLENVKATDVFTCIGRACAMCFK